VSGSGASALCEDAPPGCWLGAPLGAWLLLDTSDWGAEGALLCVLPLPFCWTGFWGWEGGNWGALGWLLVPPLLGC
jgi:hypothetical protein